MRVWSKLKQLISRCDTLTRELLDSAVARAMEAIKLQDIGLK